MKNILVALIAILLISGCASTGGSGSGEARDTRDRSRERVTVRGGRSIAMDIQGSVKSIYSSFEPVFYRNLKPRAAVAVFPISTEDMFHSEMILEQLTIVLVNDDYFVVEKRKVDELLMEYDFQMSGAVGAMTIGELLEADVVILGSITGRGVDRQLVLIAVDVKKRTTLAVAKEKL